MEDLYWVHFTQTGRISDYLEYKKHESLLKAETDENSNKGSCNNGTNNWGE